MIFYWPRWAWLRLRGFYIRLHGPTKATALGVGSLLIASVLYFSTCGEGISLHEVLVTLFNSSSPRRPALIGCPRQRCICNCARWPRSS